MWKAIKVWWAKIKTMPHWKEAVIEAAVVNGTYTEKDETDPVGAINRMLAYAAHLAESPEANPKIASLHKQIAALTAELADWKAGRYIAVVPGPEHGGVSHGVMVPPIRVPFSDEVIEKMAEAACFPPAAESPPCFAPLLCSGRWTDMVWRSPNTPRPSGMASSPSLCHGSAWAT